MYMYSVRVFLNTVKINTVYRLRVVDCCCRLRIAVLQQGRIDNHGAEGALSHVAYRGAAAAHHGQDGRLQHQLIDYATLRWLPVLY